MLRHWNLGELPGLASSPALEAGTLLAIDGPPLETAGSAESAGSAGSRGTAPQPAPATAVPPAGNASDWTVAMQARAEAYKAHAVGTYDQAVRVAASSFCGAEDPERPGWRCVMAPGPTHEGRAHVYGKRINLGTVAREAAARSD